MNPIAVGMVAIGVLLLVLGLYLVTQHRKVAGIVVSLIGLGAAATPFAVTFFLLR